MQPLHHLARRGRLPDVRNADLQPLLVQHPLDAAQLHAEAVTVAPADLIELFTGTQETAPCYRLHLAQAIADRVKPRTVDELTERVYPPNQPEPPAEALELLSAAYDTWRERKGR